jgi:hypothetical protein
MCVKLTQSCDSFAFYSLNGTYVPLQHIVVMAPLPFPVLFLLRISILSPEISNMVDNHRLPRQSSRLRDTFLSS